MDRIAAYIGVLALAISVVAIIVGAFAIADLDRIARQDAIPTEIPTMRSDRIALAGNIISASTNDVYISNDMDLMRASNCSFPRLEASKMSRKGFDVEAINFHDDIRGPDASWQITRDGEATFHTTDNEHNE